MWALLIACATPLPVDGDRDGVTSDVDCDDRDAFVFPGAVEVCDGRDNDCDGAVDDADPDVSALVWYPDPDGDGYAGDAEPSIRACEPPEGAWVRQRGDCAPDDAAVGPNRADGCDGVDSDCDGLVDEDPDRIRFVDDDGDGFGSAEVATCVDAGTVGVGGDCNDEDASVAPDRPEVCNGVDDDCDGSVDDEDADVAAPTWLPDEDRDGYGVEGPVDVVACAPPNAFWALAVGDCDDLDPTVFPGALERCDGVDSDCDGEAPTAVAWADPDRPHRLSLTVTSPVTAAPDGVAFVDVDFRAALDALGVSDAFDPATLTAWTQDCATGARALGVSFTDGFSGVLDPVDPRDPLGDETGAVHLRFVEGLPAGEPVAVGLYFGGPPATVTSPTVSSTSVTTPHLELRLDPDRGGLLDDLRVGGVNVLSQADAFEGNGVRVGGAWVRLAEPGAGSRVLAETGGIGLVESLGVGPLAADTWWWTYPDVPVAFAKMAITPQDALVADALDDVRPVQIVSPGLGAAAAMQGPGWAGFVDGVGAQWGFSTPPDGGVTYACDGGGCAASGSEAGTTTLAAGEPWLDHRTWFVVAHDGTVPADSDRVAGYLSPPEVVLGAVQSRR